MILEQSGFLIIRIFRLHCIVLTLDGDVFQQWCVSNFLWQISPKHITCVSRRVKLCKQCFLLTSQPQRTEDPGQVSCHNIPQSISSYDVYEEWFRYRLGITTGYMMIIYLINICEIYYYYYYCITFLLLFWARHLGSMVMHFPVSQEEITLSMSPLRVNLKNYYEEESGEILHCLHSMKNTRTSETYCS